MIRAVLQVLVTVWTCKLASAVTITLLNSGEINQLSNGQQYFTSSIVFMGNSFYSLYGYGFNKAPVAGGAFTLLNLNGLVSFAPISPYTTLVAIPEISRLLFINPLGGVYIIDPSNLSSPITSNYSLQYFGYNYENVYCYMIERKPTTNYFYVTSLVGKAIQKLDYTNLASALRIITGPNNDLGYEMISISSNNYLLTISVNGVYPDLYDLSGDVFLKTINLGDPWFGVVYRCAQNYGKITTGAFYFMTRTDFKGYLVNSATSTLDKMFAITAKNPEIVKYVPLTNYMVILGGDSLEFINMEGTDFDTKRHIISPGVQILFGSMEFYYTSSWYLAANFIYTNAAPSTYLFNLGSNLCHYTCATCTYSMDPSTCTSCISGYSLTSGQCNPSPALPATCATNRYKNSDGTCTNCRTNCLSCSKFTGFCVTCSALNKIDPIGNCISNCATNQYPQTISGKNYCFNCHLSCQQCTGPSKLECSTCPPTFTASSTSCNDRCLSMAGLATSYVFMNDTCNACTFVGSCKMCTFPGLSYSCIQCSAGLFSYNGLCISPCPFGLIANSASMKCEACEEKGPGFIFHNGVCIQNTNCPSGFTLSGMRCVNSTTGDTRNSTPSVFGGFNLTNLNNTSNSSDNLSTNTSANLPNATKLSSSSSESNSGSNAFTLFAIIALSLVILVVVGILIYFKCIRKSSPVAPGPAVNGPSSNRYGQQGQVEDYNPENDDYDQQPQVQSVPIVPPMYHVDFKKQSSMRVQGGPPAQFPGSNVFDVWNVPIPLPYQPKFDLHSNIPTNRPDQHADNNLSELQSITKPNQTNGLKNNDLNDFPQEASLIINTNNTRRINIRGLNR